MELKVKNGFAIKRARRDGTTIDIRLRPSRGSAGWSIWKTRRNAEAATYQNMDFTETVIPVTMRLELRQELDAKEEADAGSGEEG